MIRIFTRGSYPLSIIMGYQGKRVTCSTETRTRLLSHSISTAQHGVHPSVLQRLKTSIVDVLPYCSGFLPAKPNDLVVYYGKSENPGSASRVTLYRPSVDSLEHLVNACEPASFGRGKENVYDESYRKAGKLSSDSFIPMLEVNSTGLLSMIRERLLGGSHENKCIRAELYNLNIYNEGSFFKSHVDTPRGEAMFGSLVIFYPIAHEGGALVMRKNGQEWSFDTSKVLAEDQGPRLGYVALYSDVEHEVLPVTSGCRISITYNLYFDLHSSPTLPIPQSSVSRVTAFKSTLTELLDDPNFLPEGGNLGFGLEYAYPSHTSAGHRFDGLQKSLKGIDADIMQACKELSIETSFWTIISKQDDDDIFFACKGEVPLCEEETFNDYDMDYYDWLSRNFGAKFLVSADTPQSQDAYCCEGCPMMNITWVKPLPTDERWYKQTFISYGNEHASDYSYHTVCLLVQVGKPGERDIPVTNETTFDKLKR